LIARAVKSPSDPYFDSGGFNEVVIVSKARTTEADSVSFARVKDSLKQFLIPRIIPCIFRLNDALAVSLMG
jgi:hypothetical protein